MGLHGPVSDGELDAMVGFFRDRSVDPMLPVCTFVGVLAGYFRRLDGLLMRITNLFLSLPLLPLLLVVIVLFRDPIL